MPHRGKSEAKCKGQRECWNMLSFRVLYRGACPGSFLFARGLPILPAEPATVALYIADLGGVAKPSTITRRLAAIAKAHQAAGHESPCAMRHAPVKEVLSA